MAKDLWPNHVPHPQESPQLLQSSHCNSYPRHNLPNCYHAHSLLLEIHLDAFIWQYG